MSQLIRLVPSKASPASDAAAGEAKLFDTVPVIPSCMYIMLVARSQLIRLVPSNAIPNGAAAGAAKLLKIVEVIPSCL